jgi:hypothetical protein
MPRKRVTPGLDIHPAESRARERSNPGLDIGPAPKRQRSFELEPRRPTESDALVHGKLIRFSWQQWRGLDRLARQWGMTTSQALRQMVDEQVDRFGCGDDDER